MLLRVTGQWRGELMRRAKERRDDRGQQKVAELALQRAVSALQDSREELIDRIRELEAFHDVVVGRELKMIEVEKEVEQLRSSNLQLQK